MTKKPTKPSRAVAKAKPSQAVAVRQPQAPATFWEFVDRASRDPEFNAEKFNLILLAEERRDARDAERRFDEALAACQKELEPIRADMESDKPKNKYASYIKIDNAIRSTYSKFGFALSFDTDECPHPLTVRVVCYVSACGHKSKKFIDIPADGKGPSGGDVMTRTHATGSAVQYGRRYLLTMIFNLVVDKRIVDDDGARAGGKQMPNNDSVISDKQADKINALILETKSDITRFLAYFKTPSVSDLPVSQFQRAIDSLNAKKAKETKAA